MEQVSSLCVILASFNRDLGFFHQQVHLEKNNNSDSKKQQFNFHTIDPNVDYRAVLFSSELSIDQICSST